MLSVDNIFKLLFQFLRCASLVLSLLSPCVALFLLGEISHNFTEPKYLIYFHSIANPVISLFHVQKSRFLNNFFKNITKFIFL